MNGPAGPPPRAAGWRARAALTVGVWLATAVLAAAQGVAWTLSRSGTGPGPAPGAVETVELRGRIADGWHIYSLGQKPGGPVPLAITVPPGQDFSAAGPVSGPDPMRAFDENFNIETETYVGPEVVFRIPVRMRPDAAPGPRRLVVLARAQACTERSCLPPATSRLELTLEVRAPSAPDPATRVVAVVAPRAPALPAPRGSASADAAASTLGSGGAAAALPAGQAGSLVAFLWLAASMALLSLLTPCVFPMIPITVSYFTKHAAATRRGAVAQAAAYGLGIVLTFVALGFLVTALAGASGVNRLAANPWLNLAIAALFVVFAFSMFGAVELRLPSSWISASDRIGRAPGTGRLAGPALMGLTFTLTSFTCTAAFIGTLLVLASRGAWAWPLMGMLVYASVFAAPFVILALLPQAVARLPRSGPWLAHVKTTMGLLELAAAIKFLSNADLVWQWNTISREVVLAFWVAIALVLALHVLGVTTRHADPAGRFAGAWRIAGGVLACAAGIWLATGLIGHRLGELEAFLPPASAELDRAASAEGADADQRWIVNDFEAALAEARRDGKALFVDFTGYTCTNCRWMEGNMFPRTAVRRELERFVRVRLYTDRDGEPFERQRRMQEARFGTVALPFYAVIGSDGTPLGEFEGLTRDEDAFLTFLRAPRPAAAAGAPS